MRLPSREDAPVDLLVIESLPSTAKTRPMMTCSTRSTTGTCSPTRFVRPRWAAWRSVLKALFALAPTADDLARYTTHTGVSRGRVPHAVKPGWSSDVVGARVASPLSSPSTSPLQGLLARARSWRARHVMVLAADRRQARVVFRYISGLARWRPDALRPHRAEDGRGVCTLTNKITIEVHTASLQGCPRLHRRAPRSSTKSRSGPAEDSANPDVEIVNAIRPAMSTVPGALLLGISQPLRATRSALGRVHAASRAGRRPRPRLAERPRRP